ncbi:MAG: hypothetical protein M5U34_11650 [Chloroflexi bacterium]|nr:hypothetical protein [Chloroflexota bacterium]
MSFIIQPLLCLLGFSGLLLFVMALLSPLEALGWWAGWSKKRVTLQEPAAGLPDRRSVTTVDGSYYLVYLTAVGGVSAVDISKRERGF